MDAIIGLPANIFYGTSIPTCILILKKCRKEDDNILFIDASKEFEKVKTQNKLRPQHIKKIVDTYRERKEIEKYRNMPHNYRGYYENCIFERYKQNTLPHSVKSRSTRNSKDTISIEY